MRNAGQSGGRTGGNAGREIEGTVELLPFRLYQHAVALCTNKFKLLPIVYQLHTLYWAASSLVTQFVLVRS